jgi:hypothetical protein
MVIGNKVAGPAISRFGEFEIFTVRAVMSLIGHVVILALSS